MEFNTWFQMLGAVLAGNFLSAWFIHSAWIVSRIERGGEKASAAPWSALFGLIVPPLSAAAAIYMVRV
jgi:hypothetical protein